MYSVGNEVWVFPLWWWALVQRGMTRLYQGRAQFCRGVRNLIQAFLVSKVVSFMNLKRQSFCPFSLCPSATAAITRHAQANIFLENLFPPLHPETSAKYVDLEVMLKDTVVDLLLWNKVMRRAGADEVRNHLTPFLAQVLHFCLKWGKPAVSSLRIISLEFMNTYNKARVPQGEIN